MTTAAMIASAKRNAWHYLRHARRQRELGHLAAARSSLAAAATWRRIASL